MATGAAYYYFDSKDAMLLASLAYLAAEFEERGIHEFVVVGNIETDHTLAVEMGTEVPRQLAAVRFLHDENDVGPFDLFG